MRQHDVHAETGHQADDALRHGEGFAVGGRIGPAHGDLLALELFHSSEMVDDVQHVSHALGGVVDVALEVDQGGPLFQHAIAVAFLHRFGNRVHVGVALADVHVVAYADDVGHEGNHVRGFAHGFAVGNLRFAFVEILHFKAEQVAGAGEAEPGTRGVVAEQGDAEPGIEHPARDVGFPQAAQDFRHKEGRGDFVVGLLPRQEEVVHVHAAVIALGEVADQFADADLVHEVLLLLFGNMCARSLRERGVEIFGTGDNDFRAAVADEVHGGLDFGAHASGGEVPLG